MRRQDKPGRTHQVRRGAQRKVPFGQRTPDAQDMAALQIDDIAVHEMRRSGRSAAAKIVLLQQQNAQATPGGIVRNAHAVETASDDRDIHVRHAAIISDADGCKSSIGVTDGRSAELARRSLKG